MSDLIKRFRAEYGHTKKSLGQHFLTNAHFIELIADATGGGCICEIGAGCGVLTEALAKRTAELTAVEIDDTAVRFLEAHKAELFPALRLINDDILNVELDKLYDEPITVVGNLPYNVSVKIVEHCTKYIGNIRKLVFMFQREVAARINASRNSREYSSLSIFCSYHYDIKKLCAISGANFYPNTEVYSTVLEFTPKGSRPLGADDEVNFFNLVRQAFSQKRKTLRNNLKGYEGLSEALSAMNLTEKARGEELSLEQFITMYKFIVEKYSF
ncbi:16S rRNA (adenine(1518)-N(6)/adenine(1519)-N(6)) -dimethyltransferase RsmA [Deferribacterales bacterium RsTz2092]|nr:ribosomal RNA small subunit methyltransferase A [Deferribacterales bacterium]